MPSVASTILAFGALTTLTNALFVSHPDKNTLWDSSKSNKITWEAVNTDPETFDIYISHMASQPPLNSLLLENVSKDKGSVDVTGIQLPTGDTYQINLVAHNKPEQIYAQSAQFNVTGDAVPDATSTVEGYTGPTPAPDDNEPEEENGKSVRSTTPSAPAPTPDNGNAASPTVSHSSSRSPTSTPGNGAVNRPTNGTVNGPANGPAVNGPANGPHVNGSSTPHTPSSAVANIATGGSAFALAMAALALFA